MTWRSDAACKGKDPRHWFPVAPGSAYARRSMAGLAEDPYAYGRSICAGCPSKTECLAYALDMGATGQVDGLWGGLDEHERKALLDRRTKPQRKQPECGTTNGYKQHSRLGQEACAACREANRLDWRERRAQAS